MRYIEFRGKTTDGDWIYGDICQSIMGYKTISNTLQMAIVLDETIGQYTGLNDKNGEKIFEGDIIGFCPFDCNGNDTPYIGVVVYSGATFMIWNEPESEYYGSNGGFDLDIVFGQDDEAEVIGNIHDNPGIIGGDQC